MPLHIVIPAAAIAIAIILIVNHGRHKMDDRMHEDMMEYKRISELTDEAMQRYPALSQIDALLAYRRDNSLFIQTLKDNDGAADISEGLKAAFRDQRLMSQEIVRLLRIESEYETGFELTTSAQL